MIKFLDLSAQYNSIKSEIDEAIRRVLSDTAFIGGKFLKDFEQDFGNYVGAGFCIGVGNGTDALEVIIEAANFPVGSEIIVPGNSFIASSEAVTRSGHKVVFADVDSDCYTLSIDSVRSKISDKTKAIIAVHLYGHPCDMRSLQELCLKHKLLLIEDCAQAHGAEFMGNRIGSIGDAAAFSFYPGKNLGAYGDAGAITTNNQELATKMRMIANHGRIAKYDHEFEGRNSRLDGLQAAILSVKLKHLDVWTKRRIEIADFYLRELVDINDLILPVRKSWAKQVYHLFVIRSSRRDELAKYLHDSGIETGIHYPVALAKLRAYEYLGMSKADTFYNHSDSMLLSLPIGEHLSNQDIAYVVQSVKSFFNKG